MRSLVRRVGPLSRVAPAAVYLGAMLLWIYADLDRSDAGGTPIFDGWLVPIGVLQFAVVVLVGRWWAVLVPLVALLASVPASFDENPSSEHEVWFFLAVYPIPLALLLVAAGVGARRLARPRVSAAAGAAWTIGRCFGKVRPSEAVAAGRALRSRPLVRYPTRLRRRPVRFRLSSFRSSVFSKGGCIS